MINCFINWNIPQDVSLKNNKIYDFYKNGIAWKSLGWKMSIRSTKFQTKLFREGEVMYLQSFGKFGKFKDSGWDGWLACGQDMPFIEIGEGVFNSDSSASLALWTCSEMAKKLFFGVSLSEELHQSNAHFAGFDNWNLPKSEQIVAGFWFYVFQSRECGLRRLWGRLNYILWVDYNFYFDRICTSLIGVIIVLIFGLLNSLFSRVYDNSL